jgi:hypothetical protein
MDLKAIRANIATAIGTTIQVSPLVDAPDVPCAIIYPDAPFDLEVTFENDYQAPRFAVLIICPFVDTPSAQDQLDEYLSTGTAGSVIDAINSSASFTVHSIQHYGAAPINDTGVRYMTAVLNVAVIA